MHKYSRIRSRPCFQGIFIWIEFKFYIFDIDVTRKERNPLSSSTCRNSANGGNRTFAIPLPISMTNPRIDVAIIRSAARPIMLFSEVLAYEFEYFYISKTSCSCSSCTCGSSRSIGVKSNLPSKKNTFLFYRVIEVELSNISIKNSRTFSEIYIIFISLDRSVSILISVVSIIVSIVVDKLVLILSVPLKHS